PAHIGPSSFNKSYKIKKNIQRVKSVHTMISPSQYYQTLSLLKNNRSFLNPRYQRMKLRRVEKGETLFRATYTTNHVRNAPSTKGKINNLLEFCKLNLEKNTSA
ncbi:MAG: hypothetical protein ACRENG_32295, partial [bacterium]